MFTSRDMSQDKSKPPFPPSFSSTFHANVFLKTLNPAFTFQMDKDEYESHPPKKIACIMLFNVQKTFLPSPATTDNTREQTTREI